MGKGCRTVGARQLRLLQFAILFGSFLLSAHQIEGSSELWSFAEGSAVGLPLGAVADLMAGIAVQR